MFEILKYEIEKFKYHDTKQAKLVNEMIEIFHSS